MEGIVSENHIVIIKHNLFYKSGYEGNALVGLLVSQLRIKQVYISLYISAPKRQSTAAAQSDSGRRTPN